MEEESRGLEVWGWLTSALYGECLLVFTMLLRVGVYMAYWLWLRCAVGERFNSKRLMAMWCGVIRLSET